MPEENVSTEAVAETPTEPIQTEQSEAPVEEAPTNVEAEPTEAPAEAPSQEEIVEAPYYPPVQPEPNFEVNEEGFVDPNQFYQKVKADAVNELREEMKFQESERKAWAAVENKYPELKEDKELKDLVHNQRLADVAQGGRGDLNKVADKLFNKLNGYKIQGRTQAQVSEKVQKSASLASTTANNVETKGDSDLIERMSRGDQGARDSLIEQWLEAGKL
jgi:hypothetical protein